MRKQRIGRWHTSRAIEQRGKLLFIRALKCDVLGSHGVCGMVRLSVRTL